MGRNTGDFFDGGASARMDQYGAMQESNEFDGPHAPNSSGAENDYAGHTAGKVAGSGSYS